MNLKIYQIGDFVLPFENFQAKRKIGIKQFLEKSDLINGSIKLDRFDKSLTEDTFYDISFVNTAYSQSELDYIIFNKPQKIFFYEKFIGNDSLTDYRVYYSYCHIIDISDYNYDCQDIPQQINFTIRQIGRKYLIQDNRLRFIKNSDLLNANDKWGDRNGNWGVDNNTKWGDQFSGKAIEFNAISSLERRELINCCENIGFFDYYDLHIQQEIPFIDVKSKHQILIEMSNSDAVDTSSIYSTEIYPNKLNLNSSSDNINVIFELEKDGVLPALAQDESIQLTNNENQSGFKITCLNNSCPSKISIFTNQSAILFNSETNRSLNIFSNNSQNWKIENIGQSSHLFIFNNYNPKISNSNNQDTDNLIIRRNFTGDFKIRISNLPTFI